MTVGYNFANPQFRLISEYHGQNSQLGNPVVMMVVLVNLDERIIDFELVESLRK